jgi:type II secretory pathway pseudopilin PulG
MVRLGGRGQRGYTLVALAVMVTVLSIGAAMVLPAWSAQIQRDREEELVFRGLQYAEAIRVFQRRYGRFPNSLQELIDVKPRCIRRMWTEPTTEDGVWRPILMTTPGGPGGGQNVGPDGRPLPQGDAEQEAEEAENADGPTVVGQPVGPIIGVRTANSKKGFRTFFGQDAYSQWRFTYDLVTPGGAQAGAAFGVPGAVTGVPGVPRAAWIGRPLPGQEGPPQQPGQTNTQPGYPAGFGVPGWVPVPPENPPQQGDGKDES